MRSSAIFVAIAATAVSAQTVPTYKSSLNMTIDPNSVPQQQRAVWCQAQTNTCQLLCDNNADQNDCNQAQLTFDCTCESNNSAPGLQYYTQTLPTFICQQLFSNCIQANAGNADGQDQCKSNIQKLCATHNPPTAAEVSSLDASTAAATQTDSTTSAASHAATTTAADKSASSSAQSTTSKALAAATLGPVGAGAFALAAAGLAAYAL
ncbi:hypothetical protein GGI43DRAFT_239966 [Trichoderma evansii]